MTRSVQGIVLFSDDVREEVGNKFSFMGVLSPEVWVTEGKRVRFVCTLVLLAQEPELTVQADFELVNAVEGTKLPKSFVRSVSKSDTDTSDRWLIHLIGRFSYRVGEMPLIFRAKFRVGRQVFSNEISFDPTDPDED